uniref:FAD-binding FR-type domain-containing protein n=1 Tax=Trichobilharzia regenti TaxID=157069 RepID=A0AA85JS49_TRIRE|nr:unnamed protein product [Trichobilharzia regenti]
MDVHCITQLIEEFQITSDKQNTDVGDYLLGDEFPKSWNIDKLSLPPKSIPLLKYKLIDDEEKSVSLSTSHIYANGPLSRSDTLHAQFKSLKCLTKGNSKTVYEATLRVTTAAGFSFSPGDSISIFPENDPHTVSWLLNRLDLDALKNADTRFIVEAVDVTKARNLPSWLISGRSTSLRFLLTYCCELYIPISRRILRILADYCVNDETNSISFDRQRNRLLDFASQEGKNMFEMYIVKPQLNLLDILYMFPACRPPFIRLLEILPRLQPRAYTLINLYDESSLSVEQDLTFIFTRVDFEYNNSNNNSNDSVSRLRYPHRHHGTCSGWLERQWLNVSQPVIGDDDDDQHHRMEEENTSTRIGEPIIQIYLRQNLTQFYLPANDAPFISFIRQRKRDYNKTGSSTNNLWLIYGCRSPTTSLLFKEELSDAVNSKLLSHLCLCFSRDTVNSPDDKYTLADLPSVLREQACFPLKSHYVQECIYHSDSSENTPSEHAIELMHLVYDHRAKIMVCGDARGLAPGVFQAWIKLLAMKLHWVQTNTWCTYAELSSEELKNAQVYLQEMRKSKRYQEDIWL